MHLVFVLSNKKAETSKETSSRDFEWNRFRMIKS